MLKKLFGKKKPKLPEVYTESEQTEVEAHISAHFGAFDEVFHEIVSPDIHVDICIIPPGEARNYYTLVTLGMGAHRMHVPKELRQAQLDRAEVLINLPTDWDVKSSEDIWYWPIYWLKTIARLPGNANTWVGYGHTAAGGEPLAENTELHGVILDMPQCFGVEAAACRLSDGDVIRFYQLVPLYQDEMDFKAQHGAEALLALFGEDSARVVDIHRPSKLVEGN